MQGEPKGKELRLEPYRGRQFILASWQNYQLRLPTLSTFSINAAKSTRTEQTQSELKRI